MRKRKIASLKTSVTQTQELNTVPEANLGLGCGNPTVFSSIKEGDTVLDLGRT